MTILLFLGAQVALVYLAAFVGYGAGARDALRDLRRQAMEPKNPVQFEATVPGDGIWQLESLRIQAMGCMAENFMPRPLILLGGLIDLPIRGRLLLHAKSVVAISILEPRTGARIVLPATEVPHG